MAAASNALLLLVGVSENYRLGGPAFQRLHQAHLRVEVCIFHDQAVCPTGHASGRLSETIRRGGEARRTCPLGADQFDEARLGEHFIEKWENAPSPDLLIAKALGSR